MSPSVGGVAFPGYRLGGVAVDPPLAMAPMADVTDVHFHEVLRELGGPGLYTAEMVRSADLVAGSARCRRLVARPGGCRSFAVQVYGADPEDLAAAAVVAAEAGADVVDLNMGCPAKTLTGKACGSGLLRDLRQVLRIFRTVRRRLPDPVPLTVKTRLGWDDRRRSHVELGRMAEGEGLAGVTLHGRTRAQMFRGEADWTAIAELVQAVSIPVVGNGDVREPEDVLRMRRETGCAGVMIARGALANPWIFRQARDLLAGRTPRAPSLEERRRVILDHHDRLVGALPAREAFHRARKLVGFYLAGVPRRGGELRRRLNEPRDTDGFRLIVDAFFSELLREERAA